MAISLIPTIILGLILEKYEDPNTALGCLVMLLPPLLSVVATAIFVITLSPIIFGIATDAAWSLPWKIIALAPILFLKLVGVMIIAAIILAIIPIVGRLQSLYTLVLGGINLIFIFNLLDLMNPGMNTEQVFFIPGFWFSVGLIVIGGIMSWIGVIVSALVVTLIDLAEKGIGQLIMFPLGAIFGFIPVFMYGAWLGTQIKSHM